jgi:hypothetical protein
MEEKHATKPLDDNPKSEAEEGHETRSPGFAEPALVKKSKDFRRQMPAEPPPAKRQRTEHATPDMSDVPAPLSAVQRTHSTGSVSSELSSSSSARKSQTASPVYPRYIQEGPPAPPSTPCSHLSSYHDHMSPAPSFVPGLLENAAFLEQQQLLAEGAATPAPPNRKQDAAKPPPTASAAVLKEDFSDWAAGDRYKLIRTLGRGSYGEVAQAEDLHAGKADSYVAIKRIQSPFDQEVDAVRLYREIHILRRMRGHD